MKKSFNASMSLPAVTKALIVKAIDEGSAKAAGYVADTLRAKGFNYVQVLRIVQTVRPTVSEQEWEALMYEADLAEGDGA